MSADVDELLEATRRCTNTASRLVQRLEVKCAAKPSPELALRLELARTLRDSMLRKVDELEQLVKVYRAKEALLQPARFVTCPDGHRTLCLTDADPETCARCGWIFAPVGELIR
jgi:hypothetical protein